jgi:hypothetical protein
LTPVPAHDPSGSSAAEESNASHDPEQCSARDYFASLLVGAYFALFADELVNLVVRQTYFYEH